ncbi:MAG: hypothetical protein FRX48_04545 [Lasallia pustulata]|uniref:Vacuolar protein sorting-associated protein 51 homolog n=1 Tax=Lasallia pustulata TaxID=136370 RepID=A0A5M8PQN6_9LECA|nr:MAG: hypothetical protein FRX48_04545 [Lasallia pustulata]
MSTITSPRASVASLQTPTSSRRTSLDTVARSQASSPQPQQRRNRAALRDYYGIKSSSTAAAPPTVDSVNVGGSQQEEVRDSELDGEGFDAEGSGLKGVEVDGQLQTRAAANAETWLWVGVEIKGLDGERKALVYDNYSKLITATDTIRKMRSNMDPLIPTTSMLGPAITHIAETATALAVSLQDRTGNRPSGRLAQGVKVDRAKQRETVRWVLQTPTRMRALLEEGQKEQAEKDWEETSRSLDKWKGVAGVDEVRAECIKVLEQGEGVGNGSPQPEEIPSNGT